MQGTPDDVALRATDAALHLTLNTKNAPAMAGAPSVARVGVEPTTFRFSGGRSYQLSYLAGTAPAEQNRNRASPKMATLTGLEPATSAVTGRRANQLRHRALLFLLLRRCRRCVVPPTGFEPVLPP